MVCHIPDTSGIDLDDLLFCLLADTRKTYLLVALSSIKYLDITKFDVCIRIIRINNSIKIRNSP